MCETRTKKCAKLKIKNARNPKRLKQPQNACKELLKSCTIYQSHMLIVKRDNFIECLHYFNGKYWKEKLISNFLNKNYEFIWDPFPLPAIVRVKRMYYYNTDASLIFYWWERIIYIGSTKSPFAKTGTKDFVYTCNNHIKVDRDQVGFRMFRDTTSEGLKGDSLLKGNTRFNTWIWVSDWLLFNAKSAFVFSYIINKFSMRWWWDSICTWPTRLVGFV
jgi:hypothetical protein